MSDSITIEVDGETLSIGFWSPIATGENNTAANVGGGDADVFRDKVGAVLNLRTISGVNGVTVTENGDVIEVGTPATSGDVVGPGSSTNEAVAVFDGVTGKLIKESGATIDAGGNVTTPGTVDGRDVSADGSTLDTHVADLANPHATDVGNLGAGTLAELNTAITDATLDDVSGSRTPTVHASTHQNGGADEVSVLGLSGLLADPQTPLAHAAAHSDGGADEITVENLATAGALGAVVTSDGAGGLTMSPPDSYVDEVRTLYVGKHGNDSNAGTNVSEALLTIGAAITAATALTPVEAAPVTIRIQDPGVYAENIVLPAYVRLMAPEAEIEATSGTTVTLNVGSYLKCHRVGQSGAGGFGIVRADTAGIAIAEVDIVDLQDNASGLLNIASVNPAVLFARIESINVDTGFGVGDLSNSVGHVHCRVGDIYLGGNNAVGVARIGTSTTVGSIEHIIAIGGATGTSGIVVNGGTANLYVGQISADTSWSVAGGATLNLHVSVVDSGTPSVAGTANVVEALEVETHLNDSTIHYTQGSIDHGNLNAASLLDDDHTQYSLIDGSRAYTGGVAINAPAGVPALTGTGIAAAGSNVGVNFTYDLSGEFTSVRGFQDTSSITAASFSFSLFEIGTTFATTAAGGGTFSFLTGMLMAPDINTATGTLRNLTGFFYAPTVTAGTVLASYGVFIQDTVGMATLEIGGHFSGDEGALQVGTGAIGAPVVNGRWFQDGDLVLNGSAMSGSEVLRVVGESRLEGALQHTTGNVGFYGVTPVAQSAAYTPTNVAPDRAYDANSTTVAEIADVLGTLIADLQAVGLIG